MLLSRTVSSSNNSKTGTQRLYADCHRFARSGTTVLFYPAARFGQGAVACAELFDCNAPAPNNKQHTGEVGRPGRNLRCIPGHSDAKGFSARLYSARRRRWCTSSTALSSGKARHWSRSCSRISLLDNCACCASRCCSLARSMHVFRGAQHFGTHFLADCRKQ